MEIEKRLIIIKSTKGIKINSTCNERTIYLYNTYIYIIGTHLNSFNDCELKIINETFDNLNKSLTLKHVIRYLESNINHNSNPLLMN